MPDLIHLVYVSDLVPGLESELAAILESSIRHNREDGITGMLLFSGGNFIQVLEGEAQAVRRTFERIAKDPRHRNTIVLLDEPIASRSFADWSMGFKRLGPGDAARLPQYAPYFEFGLDTKAIVARPGVVLELLRVFASGMT